MLQDSQRDIFNSVRPVLIGPLSLQAFHEIPQKLEPQSFDCLGHEVLMPCVLSWMSSMMDYITKIVLDPCSWSLCTVLSLLRDGQWCLMGLPFILCPRKMGRSHLSNFLASPHDAFSLFSCSNIISWPYQMTLTSW